MQPEMSEINISPLIDIVFILLIFFIVTTQFIEGIQVNKPSAVTSESLEKKSLILALTKDSQVIYGGSEIDIHAIRPLVMRFNRDKSVPVTLFIDEKTPAGLVVRVIDEAQQAGAQVSIATDKNI
jgi:biopolymer transport protein ExbD